MSTKPPSPDPPASLSKDGATLWRSLVVEFDLATDLTGLMLVEAALVARDRALKADKVLHRDGLTTKAAGGRVLAHPCCAVSRDSWQQFSRSMRALGLDMSEPENPVGRPAYLNVPKGLRHDH